MGYLRYWGRILKKPSLRKLKEHFGVKCIQYFFSPFLMVQKGSNRRSGAEAWASGSFTNYVDKILAFFDHLPTSVDIFYGMNVDKKWTF